MIAERNPHADDSLLSAPLTAVTAFGLRAPVTVVVAAFGLAMLAIAITVNGLTFKTSRLDLLNPRSEYNRRWLAYLAEFGSRDDACLVVSAERTGDLTAAIDDLARALHAEERLFDAVLSRRDLSRLKAKALFYLPGEQLARIERQVTAAAQLAPGSGESGDWAADLERLNDELAHFGAASREQRQRFEEQYARLAGRLLATLGQSPQLMPGAGPTTNFAELAQFDPQYLLADEGRVGFVLTRLNNQPGEAAPASTAIARLREIVIETRQRHPRAWIGLTGMPVIEYDEMMASQFDMFWTSALSMTLVLLLYLAAYGGLRHAGLVNVLLLLGTAYSFGFVTLAVGHLNILSAAFSAVLIGLGIDFAIHYVASYLNLRRQGCDIETALMRMAVEVGPGVVTGGVTTAAAFFMAAMTDFVGVRELGLVAGGGILLCVLTTVIVLPPLILLVDRRWPLRTLPTILPAAGWCQFPVRWPRLTMALSLIVVALVALGGSRLRYDHNLLNLQPRHLESADIERQLFTRLDDSVWFGVSICDSRQELARRKAAFEQLPSVAKTEEIGSLLPEVPPSHLSHVQSICRQLALLPQTPPSLVPIEAPRLIQEVARAQSLLARESPFETPAATLLAQSRGLLASTGSAAATARLAHGQAALAQQIIKLLAPLRHLADATPPRTSDLPPELTTRFIGKNQTFLLKVYARGNVWNMAQLERFVHDLESVDSRVTGHPVQTYYASRHMQASYLWAGLYALIAVLVLLWLDFQSLRHSLLAMVPLAVGFAAMCGCLGWLDIPFNPANMIILPLILGIGVDHGVHLVHLWRQRSGRFQMSDATAVALILTASTTTASFGALILARHQGLQSLGQSLTIGVTTCLAASIVFFPALLAWLTRHRAEDAASEVCEAQSTEAAPAAADNGRPAVELSATPVAKELSDLAVTRTIDGELRGDAPGNDRTVSDEAPGLSLPGSPGPGLVPAESPAAYFNPFVTDEEIEAVVESVLSVRPAFAPAIADDEPLEDHLVAIPRRRDLPRRREAA
jgi:hopanoid biosynthesis associated RND transporter like protein HpnN